MSALNWIESPTHFRLSHFTNLLPGGGTGGNFPGGRCLEYETFRQFAGARACPTHKLQPPLTDSRQHIEIYQGYPVLCNFSGT